MESEFLAWLRARLPESPRLRLGPGDDAAVLRLGEAGEAVVTTDLLTDQIDFRAGRDDPRRIGRKALAVNLSDLAAMAARPLAAVVSLALPRRDAAVLARELYEGLLPLAERYDLSIAGGDTNTWDGGLVVSVTAIGVPGPGGVLTRRGARPGDAILVTGSLGGSILGKQFDFEPRIDEALLLAERYALHAGIDISDGLSKDLGHLAAESGCGAELELARIPVSDDARALAAQPGNTLSPLEHALGDGEDFELLLAVEPTEAARILAEQPVGVPITQIGQFVAGDGLWQIDREGRRKRLTPAGFEH